MRQHLTQGKISGHNLGKDRKPKSRKGNSSPIKRMALRTSHPAKKQNSRFSPRFTKRFFSLVLGNAALQLAPDETRTTAILPGGELIDRLQNIAGNVADRQYLNSRPLRRWSNGSGALTSTCPKINLSPPSPAISAGIVLFIYIYFVHHLILRERLVEVPKKV
jgi:hypothetical protein